MPPNAASGEKGLFRYAPEPLLPRNNHILILYQWLPFTPPQWSPFTPPLTLFTSALNGKSRERQGLAETAIPLVAGVPVVAARGDEDLVRRLFEPLGYTVTLAALPLDERFPGWGGSPYVGLRIASTVTLQTLLTHLYVLIPVLDNEKHYWVGDDEIEKLLKRGEGWLANHPEKELIVSRYLRRQRALAREALERLADDAVPDAEASTTDVDEQEQKVERPIGLHEQRLGPSSQRSMVSMNMNG